MIRRLIRRFGVDVVRYPYGIRQIDVLKHTAEQNRIKLIQHYGIDLILDVGANDGGFGLEMLQHGIQAKIVSFEPLNDAFARLKQNSSLYQNWKIENCALGNFDGESEINIAGNSVSSSILPMALRHQQSAPESTYVAKQKIRIRKLDSIFSEYSQYRNIYLKLDVQGFEKHVLEGAENSLHRIKGIQTEMSLVELYEGESTFFEFSKILIDKGFKLMSIEPGFFDDKTGQLLQLDGIWYR